MTKATGSPPKHLYHLSASVLLLELSAAQDAPISTTTTATKFVKELRLRGDVLELWGNSPEEALSTLQHNAYLQILLHLTRRGTDHFATLATPEFQKYLLAHLQIVRKTRDAASDEALEQEGFEYTADVGYALSVIESLGGTCPPRAPVRFDYRLPRHVLEKHWPGLLEKRGYETVNYCASAQEALRSIVKQVGIDAELTEAARSEFLEFLEVFFTNKDVNERALYGNLNSTIRCVLLEGPCFEGAEQVIEPNTHEWLYADTVPVSWGGLHPDATHPLLT